MRGGERYVEGARESAVGEPGHGLGDGVDGDAGEVGREELGGEEEGERGSGLVAQHHALD